MKKKILLRIAPFFLLCVICAYTWYVIITTDYAATTKHTIALILVLVNLILHFITFRFAIILTGVLLVLSMFNLLFFFPDFITSSYFLGIGSFEVNTPPIEWRIVWLLIFYLIVNVTYIKKKVS
jgi:hypothetical protein